MDEGAILVCKTEWFVGGGTNYLNLGSQVGSIPPVPVKPSLPDTTFVLPKHTSGIGHTLHASTGLVVGLGDSPVTREAFPRLEVVAETGLSFLTSRSAPSQSVTVLLPNGQAQNVVLKTRSSFSKTGRVLAGVRFRMTEKNALEFSWSRDFVSAQPCPVRGVTHNLAPTAGLVFKFY